MAKIAKILLLLFYCATFVVATRSKCDVGCIRKVAKEFLAEGSSDEVAYWAKAGLGKLGITDFNSGHLPYFESFLELFNFNEAKSSISMQLPGENWKHANDVTWPGIQFKVYVVGGFERVFDYSYFVTAKDLAKVCLHLHNQYFKLTHDGTASKSIFEELLKYPTKSDSQQKSAYAMLSHAESCLVGYARDRDIIKRSLTADVLKADFVKMFLSQEKPAYVNKLLALLAQWEGKHFEHWRTYSNTQLGRYALFSYIWNTFPKLLRNKGEHKNWEIAKKFGQSEIDAVNEYVYTGLETYRKYRNDKALYELDPVLVEEVPVILITKLLMLKNNVGFDLQLVVSVEKENGRGIYAQMLIDATEKYTATRDHEHSGISSKHQSDFDQINLGYINYKIQHISVPDLSLKELARKEISEFYAEPKFVSDLNSLAQSIANRNEMTYVLKRKRRNTNNSESVKDILPKISQEKQKELPPPDLPIRPMSKRLSKSKNVIQGNHENKRKEEEIQNSQTVLNDPKARAPLKKMISKKIVVKQSDPRNKVQHLILAKANLNKVEHKDQTGDNTLVPSKKAQSDDPIESPLKDLDSPNHAGSIVKNSNILTKPKDDSGGNLETGKQLEKVETIDVLLKDDTPTTENQQDKMTKAQGAGGLSENVVENQFPPPMTQTYISPEVLIQNLSEVLNLNRENAAYSRVVQKVLLQVYLRSYAKLKEMEKNGQENDKKNLFEVGRSFLELYDAYEELLASGRKDEIYKGKLVPKTLCDPDLLLMLYRAKFYLEKARSYHDEFDGIEINKMQGNEMSEDFTAKRNDYDGYQAKDWHFIKQMFTIKPMPKELYFNLYIEAQDQTSDFIAFKWPEIGGKTDPEELLVAAKVCANLARENAQTGSRTWQVPAGCGMKISYQKLAQVAATIALKIYAAVYEEIRQKYVDQVWRSGTFDHKAFVSELNGKTLKEIEEVAQKFYTIHQQLQNEYNGSHLILAFLTIQPINLSPESKRQLSMSLDKKNANIFGRLKGFFGANVQDINENVLKPLQLTG